MKIKNIRTVPFIPIKEHEKFKKPIDNFVHKEAKIKSYLDLGRGAVAYSRDYSPAQQAQIKKNPNLVTNKNDRLYAYHLMEKKAKKAIMVTGTPRELSAYILENKIKSISFE